MKKLLIKLVAIILTLSIITPIATPLGLTVYATGYSGLADEEIYEFVNNYIARVEGYVDDPLGQLFKEVVPELLKMVRGPASGLSDSEISTLVKMIYDMYKGDISGLFDTAVKHLLDNAAEFEPLRDMLENKFGKLSDAYDFANKVVNLVQTIYNIAIMDANANRIPMLHQACNLFSIAFDIAAKASNSILPFGPLVSVAFTAGSNMMNATRSILGMIGNYLSVLDHYLNMLDEVTSAANSGSVDELTLANVKLDEAWAFYTHFKQIIDFIYEVENTPNNERLDTLLSIIQNEMEETNKQLENAILIVKNSGAADQLSDSVRDSLNDFLSTVMGYPESQLLQAAIAPVELGTPELLSVDLVEIDGMMVTLLRWSTVAGATSYEIYRTSSSLFGLQYNYNSVGTYTVSGNENEADEIVHIIFSTDTSRKYRIRAINGDQWTESSSMSASGSTSYETELILDAIRNLTGGLVNQVVSISVEGITATFVIGAQTVSPLIIDLDGYGIDTISLSNGVYFNHVGNGFEIKTGWVGPNSGLLVRDINGDGRINNGSELFGDNTILQNGNRAANGFEALKDLDSNLDGVFDAYDDAWHEVMVWVDSNSNARTDAGELFTLNEVGIASIDLNYDNIHIIDAQGNFHLQISTATFARASKTARSA